MVYTDIRTLRAIIRKHDLGIRLRIIRYAASGCECEAYGDVSLTSSDSNRISPSSMRAIVVTLIW